MSVPNTVEDAIYERVRYASALRLGAHRQIAAVGKDGRTLRIIDPDCQREILLAIKKKLGRELAEEGFELLVCYYGDDVFEQIWI